MAFRSSAFTVFTGASSGAATMPAGVVAGDWLVAFLSIDNVAVDATGPTGWSQVAGSPIHNSAPDSQSAQCWTRLANGNEASERTWTGMSATVDQAIIVAAFSGRGTGTPLVQTTQNTTANASPVAAGNTGITALEGDDIASCWLGDSNGVTGWTGVAPSNYIEREDRDTIWVPQYLATRDGVAAGATGTLTMTWTNVGNTTGWAGFVLAIPAGGAGANNTMFFGGSL